ncbi:MAG: hypothetical protein ACRYGM_07195 [Janthinobacterium lividum]
MALGRVTKAGLEANIAQSRRHIAKQDALIVRLANQGHAESLAMARTVLATMHAHLDIEIEMLARIAPG